MQGDKHALIISGLSVRIQLPCLAKAEGATGFNRGAPRNKGLSFVRSIVTVEPYENFVGHDDYSG
jgi:hypothetical protein